MNDGITLQWLCNAVGKVVQLGQNTLLSKIDVEHEYRNIPIHPQDRDLLGMSFDIIDLELPFRLHSALTIFSAAADAVEWMGLQAGISNLLHYLDDFLIWEKRKVDGTWTSWWTCAAYSVSR